MAASHLEAARALAPRAAELATEAERARRLPAELCGALADAGLYRLCVPARLDGAEAPPRELLEVVETLAEADAATGWCVAVCATAGMLAAYVEPAAADEVFGDRGSIAGGVFAPSGRATESADRLEVSGRWRFASNVENCDWLMGGCLMLENGAPRTLAGGRSDVRLVLFPAAAVAVIDTWSVSGLRATGSHDMAVEDLGVPSGHSASLIADAPRERGPLYAFPPFGLLAASIAAVALGIARGALDDLAELAGAKTPTLSARKLAERAGVQADAARAEARLRAARSLLYAATAEAWEVARAGGSIPLDRRVGLRLAATHAVESATVAVDTAQRLGGGGAIYESSPLERRFRDIHAATQHMLVGPATWELTGRSLLGLELDDSQL
jgi:alkylation response protein AidB-like acyl-CoA dehydrogenase